YGDRTVWSRSVALALITLVRKRGQPFYLRFFDATPYPPISNPVEAVKAVLTVGSDGGTSIDDAIRAALEDLAKHSINANTIVIITDGEDSVTVKPEELRRVNARLISVMIQGDNETLRALSSAFLRAELTKEGALRIIELVK
ncbi:MAG: hypothetical protein ABWK01_06920, partial [Infirmifilum sp.]